MVDTSYMIIISPKYKRQKIAELFKLLIQVWNFQDKHVESYSNEIFFVSWSWAHFSRRFTGGQWFGMAGSKLAVLFNNLNKIKA